MKKAAKMLLLIVLTLLLIWLSGRYCWKILGFSVCESAGIEQVDVEEDHVRIRGFYPGSFPRGFLGHHAEQEGSTLYVGFKFSGLFGVFETGDFDITVPTTGTVTQVMIRTKENEYPIWPKEEQEEPEIPEESDASEMTEEPETSEIPAETEAEMEELAAPTAYEEILSRYRTALEENWGGQQLVDEGMNFMILDVASGEIGYAVDDLDDDGIPELAIGTLSGDEFYGKLIFELYTLEEGQPVQLFSSIHRDRYYYAGGIRFANLGSSAADSSYVTTLKLEDGELVDMTYTTDPAEYVQMQLEPVCKKKDVADETLYIGEYLDYDNKEPNLEIAKGADGTYIVQIGIFRLTTLSDGVGELTPEGMLFTATDSAGNPIRGIITVKDDIATVTFTDSTWPLLENGSAYQYSKSSDVPHLWSTE